MHRVSLGPTFARHALPVTHLDLHFAVGQTVTLAARVRIRFVCQSPWVSRSRPPATKAERDYLV
jgi:hypothetical protein